MTSIKFKLTVLWVPWQFQSGGRWVKYYTCVPCKIMIGSACPVTHVELFHDTPGTITAWSPTEPFTDE
jgi:hypothetical protein